MNYPELLLYWIRERYAILEKKKQGLAAPWSEDKVFQTTYFCNVRREDDKVTQWVRKTYSPHVGHPLFEYNMVLARLINRPESLETIGGFQHGHHPTILTARLAQRASFGYPIWGSAYVITTHGQKMDKLEYLAQVLNLTYERLPIIKSNCASGRLCAEAAMAFRSIDGIGSFLSAQVVADLKNTTNHPLQSAPDRLTFVQPGPGSLRGVSWFHYGVHDRVTPATFPALFQAVREYVDANWPAEVPRICNQDLQNCLCEFDKYCRVKNGTGRSKRKYDGQANQTPATVPTV